VSLEALRDEQTNLTRRRIIEAVAEVATHAHPTAFSVPAVAAAAGVSVRTVYRYFPTKEDLLDGLSEFGGGAGVYLSSSDEVTFAEYLERLPDLFGSLYENRSTVQAQNASPVGREARQRRVAARQARVRGALRDVAPRLGDHDLDRLTAVCTALGSSTTLFELVDTIGLEVDDAADVVAWAMRTLTDEAIRTGTTQQEADHDHT
jgi:AcrR family transcriptional regulator